MAKSAIITRTYENHAVTYNSEGWFNATEAAAKFGKEPREWLRLHETCEYMEAFARHRGMEFQPTFVERKASAKVRGGNSGFRPELKSVPGLVMVKRGAPSSGGGTWLHPKMAVAFARWLNVDFAVWCDEQIDSIIRGKDDWRTLRHASASTNKVVNAILQQTRADAGKDTQHFHYANEAKLVNWALCGEFTGLNRNNLTAQELDLLAHLEERNAVLLGRGINREQRQPMLKQYAMDWRMKHVDLIA